jgi:hypothetical protein
MRNMLRFICKNGKDIRGIDVAVVTRLPLSGEVVLHEIPFQQISSEEMKDTRGILEVPLMLPGGEKHSLSMPIIFLRHFTKENTESKRIHI